MSTTLNAIQQRKERLDEELKQVEKQVYDLETTYLNDSSQHGNVIKGFEGFLSQTKSTNLKKSRNFKPEDRLFSMSSTTSPVVDEIAAEKAALEHAAAQAEERERALRGSEEEVLAYARSLESLAASRDAEAARLEAAAAPRQTRPPAVHRDRVQARQPLLRRARVHGRGERVRDAVRFLLFVKSPD